MNGISELERNEYEGRLSRKIGDILVERMSSVPPDEYETITEKDDEEIKDRIFQDRSEIALLCQENRKITEDYLSCRMDIVNIHLQKDEAHNNDAKQTHEDNETISKNPENETIEDIKKECPHIEMQSNGRPLINCGMEIFITWLLERGFIDKDRKRGNDLISEIFIHNNFDSGCNEESIKRAMRKVCGPKSRKKSKSG